MTDTVLVTGGTGYLAGWCIVALLRRGYEVRTTVRSPAKADSMHAAVATTVDPGAPLSWVVADLTADDGWDRAVAGGHAVLHVASPLGADETGGPDAFIVPARDGTVRFIDRLDECHKVEGVTARVDNNVIRLLLVTDADDPAIPASLFSTTMPSSHLQT